MGSLLGWYVRLPLKLTASVMSFGSGVLISALSFDLMDEAQERGGLLATAGGFVAGALVYTGLNWVLARRGAKHRKRSSGKQPSEGEHAGSGTAIALGALLDGIPESIVIGTTMLAGGSVSTVAVIAIFISNLPEGLSSSIGMKKAGRSVGYVFGLWCSIAAISGFAAVLGYSAFAHVPEAITSLVTAVAAGAMLAMLVDTMIPEAFEETHALAGIVTVLGFLCAFTLSKLDDAGTGQREHACRPSRHDVTMARARH
jgi:ZIP family zinc transporter